MRNDIKILNNGVQIVVGTPGRLYDMMKKGFLKVDYLKLFVMDEADELMNNGFKESLR